MSEKRRRRAPRTAAPAPEQLYERYKEALRRGHVAAVRGEIDEALRAYQEASRLAPSRPTARASAGLALVRAGREAEALPHFEAAIRLAPRDEATRAGRAQALAALGRRGDAADDLDVVAALRADAGRLAEALDAATDALGLAEARHRRQVVQDLVAALGSSELDASARTTLAGAMRILEAGPGVGARPEDAAPGPGAGEGPSDLGGDGGGASGTGDEPPGATTAVPPPDPDVLSAAADAALDAGDRATARTLLLELATLHRAAARVDAALDACYRALSVAPDDVDLHLALVELYADRSWTAPAVEKLDLLDRLAQLDGSAGAAERVAAARARLP